MRFGCCAGLDGIQAVQDAGYDYIELPVGVVKAESSDSEFEPIREQIADCDIVPEAWNCLLPVDMKATGPEIDNYRIERYLRTAFERIEELGGQIVVFGSGDARRVPDGFPMDEARGQIIDFLTLAGQIAGIHGITIAVEPLNKNETNIINSVAEALEIVRAADHPFVKVLACLYHMMEENEPTEHIIEAKGDLVHVHAADTGCNHPGSGEFPDKEFFDALRKIGYDDRISAECCFGDLSTDGVTALQFLRRMGVGLSS